MPGWYRQGEARARVLEYYLVLRQIRRAHPALRAWRTRCVACRLVFLADARNRGRRDLRCPFGCRAAHRQRASSARSVAYYKTPAGQAKKRRLNAKRGRVGPPRAPPPATTAGDVRFESEIVDHVQGVTAAIERRPVGRAEVIALLEDLLRQRSMAPTCNRREALVRRLERVPP